MVNNKKIIFGVIFTAFILLLLPMVSNAQSKKLIDKFEINDFKLKNNKVTYIDLYFTTKVEDSGYGNIGIWWVICFYFMRSQSGVPIYIGCDISLNPSYYGLARCKVKAINRPWVYCEYTV